MAARRPQVAARRPQVAARRPQVAARSQGGCTRSTPGVEPVCPRCTGVASPRRAAQPADRAAIAVRADSPEPPSLPYGWSGAERLGREGDRPWNA
jgi:hypothetical protein